MVIQPPDSGPYATRRRKAMPSGDAAGATAAAQETLSKIDWTKKRIVIWMAGTGEHGAETEFTAGMGQAMQGAASIVRITYPASYQYRASVATGQEALRQVLAGIAARGGASQYEVLICGESQGGWVVGDTLADPAMRAVVKRAVLVGHPGVAVHHYHDDHDRDVLEINHRDDPVTFAMSGNVDGFLDAVGGLSRGKVWHLPTLLWFGANNPLRLAAFAQGTFRGLLFGSGGKPDAMVHDPHNYRDHMQQAIDFLLHGPAGAAASEATRRRVA